MTMTWWKRLLLSAYYHGTLPYRAWQSARASAAGMSPVMVLFYHRIADDAASPWTLSNQVFARHMDWMKRHFDMISLAEAQRRIAGRANHRPAVSITFDDGYAANCHEALPLLVSEKIPCTYFVSSKCVLQGIPFPHDVACGFEGHPNTIDEVRAMAAAGIEIGAHTRSHADLSRLKNPRKLHDEVVVAGEELQQAIGRAVRYFAFPFGLSANLNRNVFKLAHEYGYNGVCSAYGGYNFPGDDSFHIQRICADDLLRLKNWLTVDPRKTRRPYRFDYTSATDRQPAGATTA
ncbi:MAG TPA: polysaccharide deacetylase family protein [Pirellulales bacterium]|jgi:peptidoglycan/xylan/chitin deacetylase (PgdA/CDA1 family)|nr:polysaccharide deacetylase family protein [Pirellulales bacterium]